MTLPEERYLAIRSARRLLEELCDPGRTPRVPAMVRERARASLRHYPSDLDMEKLANACPDIVDNQPPTVYTKRVANQR